MEKELGTGFKPSMFGVKTVRWFTADPTGAIDPNTNRVKRILTSGQFREEIQAFIPQHYDGGSGQVTSRDNYAMRYGEAIPGVQWVGPSAERMPNNFEVLKRAFEAGLLGSKDKYDGIPTFQEVVDLAATGIGTDGALAQYKVKIDLSPNGTLQKPYLTKDETKENGFMWKLNLDGREVYIMNALGQGEITSFVLPKEATNLNVTPKPTTNPVPVETPHVESPKSVKLSDASKETVKLMVGWGGRPIGKDRIEKLKNLAADLIAKDLV